MTANCLLQIRIAREETKFEIGCGDECPYVSSKQRVEWDIPDPKNMDPEAFNRIRDLIERRVKELLRLVLMEENKTV